MNEQFSKMTDEQAQTVAAHLRIAAHICEEIAAIRHTHGEGQAQENQVLTMLRAALDSMERARVHAQADARALTTVDSGIKFFLEQIDEHKALRDAWAVAYATIESARATKH